MEKPSWNLSLAELWERFPPPIRPSKNIVKLFHIFVQLTQVGIGKTPKVLLLGSTPELRDLCNKLNISLTIVDYSKDNFDAQTRLLTLPIYDENFVEQDWRNMRLKEQFDLVLAESSINVIPQKGVSSMLKRVREHMKPGALFISKTWIMPKHIMSLSEIIKEYRTYWSELDFYSFSCGFLWHNFYNLEKDSVSVREMNDALKRLYKDGELTDNEFESIRKLEYPKVDLEIFLPQKAWILDATSQLFGLDIIALSDDPNSHLYPVMVFRAK
jgi:hypothetical protein